MPTALARLKSLWHDVADRDLVEHELDAELEAYAELLAAEKVRDGLTPDAARRAARAELGSPERVKERVRASRVDRALYTALPDVRWALRALRRAPLFAAVAVATLALGIGGTAGVFAVADAALLRPLAGVREPERLVTLQRVQRARVLSLGYPDFADVRDMARALDGAAAHVAAGLAFRGAGAAERVVGDVVTGDYFRVLGARAALGRTLGPADTLPDAPPATVLAHAFWRRAFGGDARVVGTTVTLNGRPFTVVGVAAPGFVGVMPDEPVDLWLPMSARAVAVPNLSADVTRDRSAGWLGAFARLRPGTSAAQADAEVRAIGARLAAAHPLTNASRALGVLPGVGLSPDDRAEVARVLGLLGGAVTLLLVATCVTVAGLVLARSAGRRREVAMRLALGATRARLFRQLVTEGVVLSLIAAGPAVLVAWGVARVATALQPETSTLRALDVAPDWRMLAFALGTAAVSGVLLALAPALRVSRAAPAGVIADTSPRAGARRSALQRALVAAQVAVSLVLLVATGVTVGALRRALLVRPGFDPQGVAVASVDLGMRGYDRARGERFYRALLDRLHALPGARAVSLAKTMPPRDWSDGVSVFLPGTEPPREVQRANEYEHGLKVRMNRVGPRFFATLGIPLRRGRDFTERDDSTGALVAVVSERLARALWPGADPLGRRLSWPDPWGAAPRPPMTVVGVAADIRYLSLTDEPPLLLYVPTLQAYDGRATVAVRTDGDAGAAVRAVAAAVRALDPDVPVLGARTLRAQMTNSLWRQRTAAVWVGAFGTLAVLLAALGLYGVTAQAVEQRRQEHGVRLALGAPPRRVARGVVGEALALAAAGLAVGLPAALGGASLVRAAVEGAAPSGPALPTAAALLLLGVTLAACAAPARRAARANPVDALRAD
jgi:predicted permease